MSILSSVIDERFEESLLVFCTLCFDEMCINAEIIIGI